MSTSDALSRQQTLARERDARLRTHRIGPIVHHESPKVWTVDPKLVVPKRGRAYYRRPGPAHNKSVRLEAEKIHTKGVPSVVVTIAGLLAEDMYEGRDFLPAGSFVVISRRVLTGALVTNLQQYPLDVQAGLVLALNQTTGFNFEYIQTVWIREDRIGEG